MAVLGATALVGGALWAWPVAERRPVDAPSEPHGRRPDASLAAAALRSVVAPADGPGAPAEVLARTASPGADQAPQPATEAERATAARLSGDLRRLARDLEYNANAGLAEPPQQLVMAPPEPWRPEPGTEDGGGLPPVIERVIPPSAPQRGGPVVIRGRNFRVSGVMFGAQLARVTSATGEAVVVEAPPGPAGPVTIALTNDDGSFALAPDPFTYRR